MAPPWAAGLLLLLLLPLFSDGPLWRKPLPDSLFEGRKPGAPELWWCQFGKLPARRPPPQAPAPRRQVAARPGRALECGLTLSRRLPSRPPGRHAPASPPVSAKTSTRPESSFGRSVCAQSRLTWVLPHHASPPVVHAPAHPSLAPLRPAVLMLCPAVLCRPPLCSPPAGAGRRLSRRLRRAGGTWSGRRTCGPME